MSDEGISGELVNSGVDVERIDQDVLSLYRDVVGEKGLDTFSSGTLPLAQDVLSEEPSVYEQTLTELIVVAANCIPLNSIDSFWKNNVDRNTFEFQRNFANLLTPNSNYVNNEVFHINYKSLLEREIADGVLMPEHIRAGFNFDEVDYERNSDFYRVCFADGTIDDLSRFLAGFSLLFKSDFFVDEDFRNANNVKLPQMVAIGITDKNKIIRGQEHEILSMYGMDGFVQVYESREPIKVGIINIPTTVLLPSQIAKFRNEGSELFRNGKYSSDETNQVPHDEKDAANIFALSRHHELAIKYTLLRRAE